MVDAGITNSNRQVDDAVEIDASRIVQVIQVGQFRYKQRSRSKQVGEQYVCVVFELRGKDGRSLRSAVEEKLIEEPNPFILDRVLSDLNSAVIVEIKEVERTDRG